MAQNANNNTARPVVLGGTPTWAPAGEVRWDRWGGTAPSWDVARNADNPNAIIWPQAGEPEARRLAQVGGSGQWAYNGPMEAELARRLRSLSGARHYQPIANGSVAVTMAVAAVARVDQLRGTKTPDRPEVVTSAMSFNATPLGASLNGLVPVFVDIDPRTLVPTVEAIAAAITKNTRILLVPAMYAAITPLDQLRQLADRHNLWLIVDGAHAPFGTWNGRPFTDYAHIATTSFQLGKVLTSGEGGGVATNDPALMTLMDMVRNVGSKPAADWVPAALRNPEFRFQGYNQRLAEPQAALLLAQLERYPSQERQREAQYAMFIRELASAGLPFTPLQKTGGRILYKVGLYNGTSVPTAALQVALRRQLTGEVNAPYAPLCDAASGYVPETAGWQFGFLGGRRKEHFAATHAASERLLMVAHDFWLRRDAAEHLLGALTVVARSERELAEWASRQR